MIFSRRRAAGRSRAGSRSGGWSRFVVGGRGRRLRGPKSVFEIADALARLLESRLVSRGDLLGRLLPLDRHLRGRGAGTGVSGGGRDDWSTGRALDSSLRGMGARRVAHLRLGLESLVGHLKHVELGFLLREFTRHLIRVALRDGRGEVGVGGIERAAGRRAALVSSSVAAPGTSRDRPRSHLRGRRGPGEHGGRDGPVSRPVVAQPARERRRLRSGGARIRSRTRARQTRARAEEESTRAQLQLRARSNVPRCGHDRSIKISSIYLIDRREIDPELFPFEPVRFVDARDGGVPVGASPARQPPARQSDSDPHASSPRARPSRVRSVESCPRRRAGSNLLHITALS